MILTGTPAPTSLLNLWAPFYIVDHGKRLMPRFEDFRDRFFHKEGQVADHIFRYGLDLDELEVQRPDAKDGAPITVGGSHLAATVELAADD